MEIYSLKHHYNLQNEQIIWHPHWMLNLCSNVTFERSYIGLGGAKTSFINKMKTCWNDLSEEKGGLFISSTVGKVEEVFTTAPFFIGPQTSGRNIHPLKVARFNCFTRRSVSRAIDIWMREAHRDIWRSRHYLHQDQTQNKKTNPMNLHVDIIAFYLLRSAR